MIVALTVRYSLGKVLLRIKRPMDDGQERRRCYKADSDYRDSQETALIHSIPFFLFRYRTLL